MTIAIRILIPFSLQQRGALMTANDSNGNGEVDILTMARVVFRLPGNGITEMGLCGEDFYSPEGLAARAAQRPELLAALQVRYN